MWILGPLSRTASALNQRAISPACPMFLDMFSFLLVKYLIIIKKIAGSDGCLMFKVINCPIINGASFCMPMNDICNLYSFSISKHFLLSMVGF